MCRACDVMDILRRASYLPQLRRMVIAHDASMPMRVCIPVADVPSLVLTHLLNLRKVIDNLIDIDFVPDRRMPSAQRPQH